MTGANESAEVRLRHPRIAPGLQIPFQSQSAKEISSVLETSGRFRSPQITAGSKAAIYFILQVLAGIFFLEVRLMSQTEESVL